MDNTGSAYRTVLSPAAEKTDLAPQGPARRLNPRASRAGEVLDLIRRGEAETTTELANAMGLARSTVSERIEALQRLRLLVPAGETTPSRGRPAGRLAFNAKAGVTLTAQVGMSGTMVALTDLAGEVEWHNQVQLDVASGPDALYNLLREQFDSGLKHLGRDPGEVSGIGIGLPGDIEIASSPARSAKTVHEWSDQALASRLGDAYGTFSVVDRDVNLMALGEHRSSWPESKVFMCLKVGTVIACGLVIEDQVVRGASGLLGEVGHTKVPGGDLPCACGSRGCLNTVAGGAALAAHLRDLGLDANDARDVSVLANSGNIPAGQAVRIAGERIGEVIASAINLLNPDVITVWGYLVDAGDQFLAGLQESVYKTALPSSARAAIITRARLGDDVGLRGAALTVVEKALQPDKIDALVDALEA